VLSSALRFSQIDPVRGDYGEAVRNPRSPLYPGRGRPEEALFSEGRPIAWHPMAIRRNPSSVSAAVMELSSGSAFKIAAANEAASRFAFHPLGLSLPHGARLRARQDSKLVLKHLPPLGPHAGGRCYGTSKSITASLPAAASAYTGAPLPF
jgi:hypothetical protein